MIWAWFIGNPWRIACLILLAALGAQTARIEGFLWMDGYRASLAASERRTAAEHAAHAQTRLNYRNAQKQAEAAERDRLARVKGEQERISDHVSQDYARELDDLRARYARLRAQARAAGGAPGGVAMPSVPGSTVRADGTSGSDRLLDILLAADENTVKLLKLQDWVAQQTGVPTN